MIPEHIATSSWGRVIRSGLAVFLCMLLGPGELVLYSQPQAGGSPEQEAPKIPNDQLDSLVAPIALYPDPLLSQVLVASTYPLEIIQLQQWLEKNKNLKDKALTDALMKQDWDPSIQSMAVLPDVVKQMADNIKWTTDLGNAFLAQQADVMDAVQRMRMKAEKAGNLKSNQQMKVETEVVENKTVVVIQQANPQVVYVPSYNPVVVYGPPIYPYPPIYYPPPGYYAGAAIGFGVGIAIGAAWGGGGWGYGCGWGRNNNININVNNNYISHYNRTNINNVNRNNINNVNRGGNNTWQHNPQHRGGTPYSNKATANKYGGSARGDSMSSRQANARQQQGAGSRQQPSSGSMNRNSGASNMGANRGSGRASNMSVNRGGSGGGADRIGSQQIPKSSGSRNSSAFGGSSNGASARASSSRGASSMGSRGGGGGGGSRGGGGGRRR